MKIFHFGASLVVWTYEVTHIILQDRAAVSQCVGARQYEPTSLPGAFSRVLHEDLRVPFRLLLVVGTYDVARNTRQTVGRAMTVCRRVGGMGIFDGQPASARIQPRFRVSTCSCS